MQYQEDKYYTPEIEDMILEKHNLELVSKQRKELLKEHKLNTETDVILYCKTEHGRKRKIGIELKESDLVKAVHQAMVRREFFNYFYVVINHSVEYIVDWILGDYNLLSAIKIGGIGIISYADKIMVRPSKFFRYTANLNDNMFWR